MESLVHPKKSFLCSSIRLLPSECLESNLLVPFPVATSDSLHSLTHAFLPVFCHTFNSDANSDYNFFHSLSPSYLRPFLVLLPKPLSSGSKSNIILQPTRKLALPQKGGRESEGFVSLESSKEIIFETNFAKGEQNPLEEKEEEENRPIVRVLINFAAFFNPTGKLPLKRESSEKLFIECQNFPP